MKTPPFRLVAAISLIGLAVAMATPIAAQELPEFRVTITNLTRSQIFSPPLVVSHFRTASVFVPGEPAYPELAELAEDGNPGPLAALLDGAPGIGEVVVAPGMVFPGESISVDISMNGFYNRLTVLGMLVTTNDAFFSVHGVDRPIRRLPAVYPATAYDAGSEANNELCDFIPGPPCGNGGVRAEDGAEGFIHVHPGIHGIGDLNASELDWRNPVAYVRIQRIR